MISYKFNEDILFFDNEDELKIFLDFIVDKLSKVSYADTNERSSDNEEIWQDFIFTSSSYFIFGILLFWLTRRGAKKNDYK